MADSDKQPTYEITNNVTSQLPCWTRLWSLKVYEHNNDAINFPDASSSQSSSDETKFTEVQAGDTVLNLSNYDASGNLISGDSLRVYFEVKRYAIGQPNIATIKIYNLTAEMEKKLIMEGYRVILNAGYLGKVGDIFDGFVIMCSRTRENGTDYTMTIEAMDGYYFLKYGYCNFSVQKGATARDVVKNIANQAGSPIELGFPKDGQASELDKQKYTRGQSVHGLAGNTLDDIAKAQNATWFVDNGKLYILKYGESVSDMPMGKQAVVLSPDTGLIGNPTQIEYGINAKTLLNPTIVPFCFVYLDPEYVTQTLPDIGSNGEVSNAQVYQLDPHGLYRVTSCKFTGDTRSNDWFAEINAIIQSGSTPQMLTATGTAN